MTPVYEDHSRYSPSASKRWMNCPGSIGLIETLAQEERVSGAALEGRKAHTLAEQWLRFNNPPICPDAEMLEGVRVFVEHVLSLGGMKWLERRVDIVVLANSRWPIFGTADCIVYVPETKTLHIVDLKYGRVLVEADDPQFLLYAVGALQSVVPVHLPIDTFVTTVVQPRAYHPNGPVRSMEWDAVEMMGFIRRVKSAVIAAETPGAPLNAGTHCTFCPAAPHCSALQSHALTIAQQEFDVLPQEIIDPPAPETLPNEIVADILNKLPILDAWMEALREHAKQKLMNGEEVPGYRLEQKRTHRVWASLQDAEEWLKEKGVSLRKLTVRTPADVEQEAGELPQELLMRLVEYKLGKAREAGAQQPRQLERGDSHG